MESTLPLCSLVLGGELLEKAVFGFFCFFLLLWILISASAETQITYLEYILIKRLCFLGRKYRFIFGVPGTGENLFALNGFYMLPLFLLFRYA